jgi:hypothetical protein
MRQTKKLSERVTMLLALSTVAMITAIASLAI